MELIQYNYKYQLTNAVLQLVSVNKTPTATAVYEELAFTCQCYTSDLGNRCSTFWSRTWVILLAVGEKWRVIPEDKPFHPCSSNNELSHHLDNVQRHYKHKHNAQCRLNLLQSNAKCNWNARQQSISMLQCLLHIITSVTCGRGSIFFSLLLLCLLVNRIPEKNYEWIFMKFEEYGLEKHWLNFETSGFMQMLLVDSSVDDWCKKWKWSWKTQLQHSAGRFRSKYLLLLSTDTGRNVYSTDCCLALLLSLLLVVVQPAYFQVSSWEATSKQLPNLQDVRLSSCPTTNTSIQRRF